MFTMLGLMPFAFNVSASNSRISVTLMLILSSINFKISVTNRIPSVSYFTVLDKYALPALIYLGTLVIYHAIIGSTFISSSFKNVIFIDRIVFYSVSGIYLSLSVIYLIYFLSKLIKQKRIEKEFMRQSELGLAAFSLHVPKTTANIHSKKQPNITKSIKVKGDFKRPVIIIDKFYSIKYNQ